MNKIILIVSVVAIFFLSMGNAFAKTALTVYTAVEAEDLKKIQQQHLLSLIFYS